MARIEKLVRDLLNLSSLELLTNIDPNPVHLSEILNSLVDDYRILAAARNITLEINTPGDLAIKGDKEKIKRAFSNILDNAIKYNVDGGRVKVIMSSSENDITIVIANTGPGVSQDEITKIFNQFYRVEKSRSIDYGGSGLGLAIVKRIVELHGGKVVFESRQNDWTRVTVNFFCPVQD